MNTKSLVTVIISVALLGTAAYTAVRAQSSTSYALDWNVIGSGGDSSQSNSFVMSGTFGQTAASPPESSSASYTVTGGYWAGIVSTSTPTPTSTPKPTATPTPDRLYLPQVSR